MFDLRQRYAGLKYLLAAHFKSLLQVLALRHLVVVNKLKARCVFAKPFIAHLRQNQHLSEPRMFGAQVLHDRCSEEDIGARQVKEPESVIDSVVSLSPELRGELNARLHKQILFLDFFVVTVHLVLRK